MTQPGENPAKCQHSKNNKSPQLGRSMEALRLSPMPFVAAIHQQSVNISLRGCKRKTNCRERRKRAEARIAQRRSCLRTRFSIQQSGLDFGLAPHSQDQTLVCSWHTPCSWRQVAREGSATYLNETARLRSGFSPPYLKQARKRLHGGTR